MSRVPAYPAPGPMYYHQSAAPAQAMMQPPPGPYGHPPHPQDPAMYASYPRDAPLQPGQAPGSRGMTWNGAPGEEYGNATAGPSRGADPAAYGYRTSPTGPPTSSSRGGPVLAQPGQAGGPGWSSVHPGAPGAARMENGARGSVKLEDLVSHDRTCNGGTTSRPVLNHGPALSGLTSIPLAEDGKGSNSRRPSAQGGGDTGGQAGPSEFIKKLYRMLEDENATYGKSRSAGKHKHGSVGWGKGGTTFVVWDMNDFTTKVLPQTFRHSNFSSFVRQLNKYGFSKIKHVDEDSGQIKENVWEFQHPNFQTGGKADLDSIKRKQVAPKKNAGEGEAEPSPSKLGGMNPEDAGRLVEMEHRVRMLEDQLAKALDEVNDARSREAGTMNLIREIIGHMASVEKDPAGSPTVDGAPSSRIVHLFRMFDQVASGSTFTHPPPMAQVLHRFPSGHYQTPAGPPLGSAHNHASPMTDGGSRASDGPSPAPSRGSFSGPRPGSRGHMDDGMDNSAAQAVARAQQAVINHAQAQANVQAQAAAQAQAQAQVQVQVAAQAQAVAAQAHVQAQAAQAHADVEAQAQVQAQQPQGMNADATLYNGEPMGMTPVFAETPAWLTENTPLPPYNRKASDATTLRLMVEALSSQNPTEARFDELPSDPLAGQTVTTDNNGNLSTTDASAVLNSIIPPPAEPVPPLNGTATVDPSAFGGLVFPVPAKADPPTSGSPENTKDTKVVKRSPIQPHWTTSPRILVVEDDVVYRQLSSKFLEKFGCVTETVEDAQGAVSKMNHRKYDLVLMDIFFGPSMDGRKATSLIRQFDMYTPIISMTSNVQTQDVNSYLQSGMNDVLAKPFTKHGLFGILDKHLIHLKAIQLSAEVPRSLGLPPLSDEGVQDALQTGATQWVAAATDVGTIRNPLAAMGWSDETYQLVLQQFMATGSMPEVSTISNGTIGTQVIFGNAANFGKRSIETLDDDWNAGSASIDPTIPNTPMAPGPGVNGIHPQATIGIIPNNTMMPSEMTINPGMVAPVGGVAMVVGGSSNGRSSKKMKKGQA